MKVTDIYKPVNQQNRYLNPIINRSAMNVLMLRDYNKKIEEKPNLIDNKEIKKVNVLPYKKVNSDKIDLKYIINNKISVNKLRLFLKEQLACFKDPDEELFEMSD